ncbi:N-acetylmuramoyl-L-alanine amidase [Aliagarivorans taiwanensis]|uniref:N-acetylmuramoyl-L-alanine amidase n=1 Tax=Aliagarivorans taiwanensis TaxID=561966 RepID=UPI000550B232|nr:N-acetylmuramoyl-L-alanine amidase [Aliagarivorans taiwanensis]
MMKAKWFWVFPLMLMLASANALANKVSGIRVWAGPENTRLVLDLSSAADYSYFNLSNPHRLVLDLSNTQVQVDLAKVSLSGNLVKKLRPSTPKAKQDYRLVIELGQSVKPVVFPLKPTGSYGHRLVIDLPDKKGEQRVAQEQQQVAKTQSTQQLTGDRDIVIAIDPGHGGEDPGAIGPKRTYEKGITLAISKRVVRLLNQEPGLKGVLTRTGDYYVNLNRRSQIARKHRADFLVSVHADGFSTPQPRGASVWVVSAGRAKSEVGRHIEDHEVQSELLGGVGEVMGSVGGDAHLNFALVDMQKDYSMNTAYSAATEILRELGKVAHLHKKKPEHASLAVLKSPDIPSVLVEAGFITNPGEEKNLRDGNYQERIAKAIVAGIKQHYRRQPPAGTLYAMRHAERKHTVQRGESLSVLAQRYKVSVAGLKRANNLSSDSLRIGQVLVIPSS